MIRKMFSVRLNILNHRVLIIIITFIIIIIIIIIIIMVIINITCQ